MRITPAVKIILIVNIVFFALSELICPMFPLGGYTDWFTAFNALHPIGSSNFAIYQYVTYMFMHGGWMHLFFNMWSLMIFGNSVEMQVGTKRFVYYYLICGIGSALVNQFMSFLGIIPQNILVGASGAIYGVMAAAAYYFPNAKLFIIPIPFPIKLKWLVAFYTAFEMYNGFMSVDGVAHFAHLGGIFVGAVILIIWKHMDNATSGRRRWNSSYSSSGSSYSRTGSSYDTGETLVDRLKNIFKKERKPKMTVHSVRETNYQDHEYNSKKKARDEEIDRILDKIRQSGYQNLSDEEKRTLFDASKSMQK